MAIRIVIVDDHEVVRKGLIHLLDDAPDIEIAGTYNRGGHVIAAIGNDRPDVILLDLQLPDISGVELLPAIKKSAPYVKVLVFSSNENIYSVRLLLNSGADGYLFKNISDDTLTDAIRQVHQNNIPYLIPEVKELLKRKSKVTATMQSLTPREADVLQLIAQEMTSQEIAVQLGLSYRTVEIYRLGLMQKLDVRNMVGMVKKAIMLGLIKE